MFRTEILGLFREAASEAGLHFQHGFPYRMSRANLPLPALWLEPLVLREIEGRDEGTLCYRLSMYLMCADRKYDEAQKEEQWGALERTALEMIRAIVLKKTLLQISNVSCTPAEFTLTNRGELSIKCEFDLRIAFSEPDFQA